MLMAIAFLLSFLVVYCTVRYVPARRRAEAAYVNLQHSTRRAITPARTKWDIAQKRQLVFALTGTLFCIGVIFSVFLPGVESIVQFIPLVIALVSMGVIGVTALWCSYREQTS